MHAVLNLITPTYDNIKDNTYTGILFPDLTKAFDTVCHQTLLGKLEHYGIRGLCLQLLNSFLKRKQFVSLDGVNSELHSNNFGVPQESLLGPLLFLHHVNDLPNAVLGSPTLFADDTCLMLKHSNLSTLQRIGIARIFDWGGGKPQITCNTSSEIFKRGAFCGEKIIS